jgi:hypothetical protein
MSCNVSPNLIVMKILEEIDVLFFYYKTLIERFRRCGGDWCDFPYRAILVFQPSPPYRWHALLDTRNVAEDNVSAGLDSSVLCNVSSGDVSRAVLPSSLG